MFSSGGLTGKNPLPSSLRLLTEFIPYGHRLLARGHPASRGHPISCQVGFPSTATCSSNCASRASLLARRWGLTSHDSHGNDIPIIFVVFYWLKASHRERSHKGMNPGVCLHSLYRENMPKSNQNAKQDGTNTLHEGTNSPGGSRGLLTCHWRPKRAIIRNCLH